MSNNDEITALSVVTEAAASFAAPVQTGLLKAVSNLIGGLTSIPAAWLKRPAQSIEDVTAARSMVAGMLAKGVAEQALKDPVLMEAATDLYLPSTIRKARNRVQIAQRTAEQLSDAVADAEDGGASALPPEDDWMNAFCRFAEDASSEKMQDLLARLLAGQVVSPGAFGLSTLRTVSELDQAMAQDFSLVWERSVGDAVDYDADFRLGEWFGRWRRLAEAGLMANSDTVQYLPSFHSRSDGNALWSPISAGGSTLVIKFAGDCRANWAHIDFTRIGREIGRLLPAPNYRENIRKVGVALAQRGVVEVELRSRGYPSEILGRAGE